MVYHGFRPLSRQIGVYTVNEQGYKVLDPHIVPSPREVDRQLYPGQNPGENPGQNPGQNPFPAPPEVDRQLYSCNFWLTKIFSRVSGPSRGRQGAILAWYKKMKKIYSFLFPAPREVDRELYGKTGNYSMHIESKQFPAPLGVDRQLYTMDDFVAATSVVKFLSPLQVDRDLYVI